eukprot:Clim_evm2s40 gene=Clim_evmTU2s40
MPIVRKVSGPEALCSLPVAARESKVRALVSKLMTIVDDHVLIDELSKLYKYLSPPFYQTAEWYPLLLRCQAILDHECGFVADNAPPSSDWPSDVLEKWKLVKTILEFQTVVYRDMAEDITVGLSQESVSHLLRSVNPQVVHSAVLYLLMYVRCRHALMSNFRDHNKWVTDAATVMIQAFANIRIGVNNVCKNGVPREVMELESKFKPEDVEVINHVAAMNEGSSFQFTLEAGKLEQKLKGYSGKWRDFTQGLIDRKHMSVLDQARLDCWVFQHLCNSMDHYVAIILTCRTIILLEADAQDSWDGNRLRLLEWADTLLALLNDVRPEAATIRHVSATRAVSCLCDHQTENLMDMFTFRSYRNRVMTAMYGTRKSSTTSLMEEMLRHLTAYLESDAFNVVTTPNVPLKIEYGMVAVNLVQSIVRNLGSVSLQTLSHLASYFTRMIQIKALTEPQGIPLLCETIYSLQAVVHELLSGRFSSTNREENLVDPEVISKRFIAIVESYMPIEDAEPANMDLVPDNFADDDPETYLTPLVYKSYLTVLCLDCLETVLGHAVFQSMTQRHIEGDFGKILANILKGKFGILRHDLSLIRGYALFILSNFLKDNPSLSRGIDDSTRLPTQLHEFLCEKLPKEAEVVDALCLVYNNLCLNKEMLEQFKHSQALHRFFDIFIDPEYTGTLMSQALDLKRLGRSLADLGQQYPDLKPLIAQGLLRVLSALEGYLDLKPKEEVLPYVYVAEQNVDKQRLLAMRTALSRSKPYAMYEYYIASPAENIMPNAIPLVDMIRNFRRFVYGMRLSVHTQVRESDPQDAKDLQEKVNTIWERTLNIVLHHKLVWDIRNGVLVGVQYKDMRTIRSMQYAPIGKLLAGELRNTVEALKAEEIDGTANRFVGAVEQMLRLCYYIDTLGAHARYGASNSDSSEVEGEDYMDDQYRLVCYAVNFLIRHGTDLERMDSSLSKIMALTKGELSDEGPKLFYRKRDPKMEDEAALFQIKDEVRPAVVPLVMSCMIRLLYHLRTNYIWRESLVILDLTRTTLSQLQQNPRKVSLILEMIAANVHRSSRYTTTTQESDQNASDRSQQLMNSIVETLQVFWEVTALAKCEKVSDLFVAHATQQVVKILSEVYARYNRDHSAVDLNSVQEYAQLARYLLGLVKDTEGHHVHARNAVIALASDVISNIHIWRDWIQSIEFREKELLKLLEPIVAMGFTEETILNALREADFDTEKATNLLLDRREQTGEENEQDGDGAAQGPEDDAAEEGNAEDSNHGDANDEAMAESGEDIDTVQRKDSSTVGVDKNARDAAVALLKVVVQLAEGEDWHLLHSIRASTASQREQGEIGRHISVLYHTIWHSKQAFVREGETAPKEHYSKFQELLDGEVFGPLEARMIAKAYDAPVSFAHDILAHMDDTEKSDFEPLCKMAPTALAKLQNALNASISSPAQDAGAINSYLTAGNAVMFGVVSARVKMEAGLTAQMREVKLMYARNIVDMMLNRCCSKEVTLQVGLSLRWMLDDADTRPLLQDNVEIMECILAMAIDSYLTPARRVLMSVLRLLPIEQDFVLTEILFTWNPSRSSKNMAEAMNLFYNVMRMYPEETMTQLKEHFEVLHFEKAKSYYGAELKLKDLEIYQNRVVNGLASETGRHLVRMMTDAFARLRAGTPVSGCDKELRWQYVSLVELFALLYHNSPAVTLASHELDFNFGNPITSTTPGRATPGKMKKTRPSDLHSTAFFMYDCGKSRYTLEDALVASAGLYILTKSVEMSVGNAAGKCIESLSEVLLWLCGPNAPRGQRESSTHLLLRQFEPNKIHKVHSKHARMMLRKRFLPAVLRILRSLNKRTYMGHRTIKMLAAFVTNGSRYLFDKEDTQNFTEMNVWEHESALYDSEMEDDESANEFGIIESDDDMMEEIHENDGIDDEMDDEDEDEEEEDDDVEDEEVDSDDFGSGSVEFEVVDNGDGGGVLQPIPVDDSGDRDEASASEYDEDYVDSDAEGGEDWEEDQHIIEGADAYMSHLLPEGMEIVDDGEDDGGAPESSSDDDDDIYNDTGVGEAGAGNFGLRGANVNVPGDRGLGVWYTGDVVDDMSSDENDLQMYLDNRMPMNRRMMNFVTGAQVINRQCYWDREVIHSWYNPLYVENTNAWTVFLYSSFDDRAPLTCCITPKTFQTMESDMRLRRYASTIIDMQFLEWHVSSRGEEQLQGELLSLMERHFQESDCAVRPNENQQLLPLDKVVVSRDLLSKSMVLSIPELLRPLQQLVMSDLRWPWRWTAGVDLNQATILEVKLFIYSNEEVIKSMVSRQKEDAKQESEPKQLDDGTAQTSKADGGGENGGMDVEEGAGQSVEAQGAPQEELPNTSGTTLAASSMEISEPGARADAADTGSQPSVAAAEANEEPEDEDNAADGEDGEVGEQTTDMEEEIPEGLDPEFLAALPEDLRGEVIANHRRMNEATRESHASNVPPEVLAAMPPDIQYEILHGRVPLSLDDANIQVNGEGEYDEASEEDEDELEERRAFGRGATAPRRRKKPPKPIRWEKDRLLTNQEIWNVFRVLLESQDDVDPHIGLVLAMSRNKESCEFVIFMLITCLAGSLNAMTSGPRPKESQRVIFDYGGVVYIAFLLKQLALHRRTHFAYFNKSSIPSDDPVLDEICKLGGDFAKTVKDLQSGSVTPFDILLRLVAVDKWPYFEVQIRIMRLLLVISRAACSAEAKEKAEKAKAEKDAERAQKDKEKAKEKQEGKDNEDKGDSMETADVTGTQGTSASKDKEDNEALAEAEAVKNMVVMPTLSAKTLQDIVPVLLRMPLDLSASRVVVELAKGRGNRDPILKLVNNDLSSSRDQLMKWFNSHASNGDVNPFDTDLLKEIQNAQQCLVQCMIVNVMLKDTYFVQSYHSDEKHAFEIKNYASLANDFNLVSLWEAIAGWVEKWEAVSDAAQHPTLLKIATKGMLLSFATLPPQEELRHVMENDVNLEKSQNNMASRIGTMDLSASDQLENLMQSGVVTGMTKPVQTVLNDWTVFIRIMEKMRSYLNEIIGEMNAAEIKEQLQHGILNVVLKSPRIIEFDNKRKIFRILVKKISNRKKAMRLHVRRAHLFQDSFRQVMAQTTQSLRGRLNVTFAEEGGIDAGGLTREWFQKVSEEMLNPQYALFTRTALSAVYQPDKRSWVNPTHLDYFRFIGRAVGKALFDNNLLDVHFARSFYKHMLGRRVTYHDMEALDPEFHRSLVWILENDITDVMELTFTTEVEEFGETKVIELKPNGGDIAVTEENKREYVQLVCQMKMTTAIQPQIDAFNAGFHDVLPSHVVNIFDDQELELMISGTPEIDIDDMQVNSVYSGGYSARSPQVEWFWRALRSYDNEMRAKLLQFVTGTSKVPLGGFAALYGFDGPAKFNITRRPGESTKLPTAHTCFNQLDLPEYESYEKLLSMLTKAVSEGHEGFGFA